MERLDLFLVRHAPAIHPKGIVPPHDPDADCTDSSAFASLARALPEKSPWWVSPLTRCRMTANTLVAHGATAASIIFDDRLREQDYGSFHGRPVADVWEEIKDEPRSNWHFLHPSFCPPQGESFLMLHDRMAAVLGAIEGADTPSLVLVGHGMATRSLIAHALDLPVENALAFSISPLSLTRMTLIRTGGSSDPGNGGRWQLDWLNRVY